MAPPRPYSFLQDVLTRSARFLYLLWGGMLLGTLALFNRVRLPDFIWDLPPELARSLSGPWGRGLFLGLALAMLLGALREAWELVDHLLVRILHRHDVEH
jgi:hypothetical protein